MDRQLDAPGLAGDEGVDAGQRGPGRHGRPATGAEAERAAGAAVGGRHADDLQAERGQVGQHRLRDLGAALALAVDLDGELERLADFDPVAVDLGDDARLGVGVSCPRGQVEAEAGGTGELQQAPPGEGAVRAGPKDRDAESSGADAREAGFEDRCAGATAAGFGDRSGDWARRR